MRFPVKKSTSLLGVAALAASLSLTACGGDDGGGSDDDDRHHLEQCRRPGP